MVIRFGISGEVFVTADKRETADPRGLALYAKAFTALREAKILPMSAEAEPREPEPAAEREEPEEPADVGAEPEEKEPRFRYPIHYSGVGEVAPKVEWDDKAKIGTWIGRLYLWQKQDEEGGLLELQADNAVVFGSVQEPGSGEERTGDEGIFGDGFIGAIYLCGDVLMTEGGERFGPMRYIITSRPKRRLR